MTSIGWKRFSFFDEFKYRDTSLPDGVTTSCPGQDEEIWLGCADGLIVCLDKELAVKATFPSFRGKIHFISIEKGKLVCLGEEADGIKSLTLKAWDVTAIRSGITPPTLALAKIFASAKLPEGSIQSAIVCIHDWPTATIALGTSTGAVHIFKGDVVKSKLTSPFGRHVIKSGIATPTPITALYFSGAHGQSRHIFAVTESSLAALDISTGQILMEDDCGAPRGCSVLTPNGELLITGADAGYFYSADEGRKAAIAIKQDKHVIVAFKTYIAAVITEETSTLLRVYDIANKIIAASVPLESSAVQWIMADGSGSGVIAVDTTGVAIRLREKPLEERLHSMYRNRSFQLALRTAVAENVPAKVIAEVHRHFGDFLYGKRDYDGAAMHYVSTIGYLEPSYAIQKFLDAQKIHNLTMYLEMLHEKGVATGDHTTLLLNCYAKLRDTAKIDAFVQSATTTTTNTTALTSTTTSFPSKSLRFDSAAAVSVLRNAGYFEHALFIALAADDADSYLQILLEDCHRYEEALKYIRSLGRRRGAHALIRHGRILVEHDSVETTALLMELCLPRSRRDVSTAKALPSAFVPGTTTATSSTPPHNTTTTTSTTAARDDGVLKKEHAAMNNDVIDTPINDDAFIANLADFTHLYSQRPDDLRYACVTILAMSPHDMPSRQTLYHTLLDLYLGNSKNSAKTAPSSAADTRTTPMPTNQAHDRDQALDLLRRGWPPGQQPIYDTDRALTACRLHSFHQGLVFLYNNMRMYRESAAVLASIGDWQGLIDICEQYGSVTNGGDPEIWQDALERVASVSAGPGAEIALKQLLSRIEATGSMPSLVVLPILARNPHLRLEVVKGYVERALHVENAAIEAHVKETERLKSEVKSIEETVKKLTTEPVVFQASKDSQTGAPLELPSVHFLCGHSYNLRTLGNHIDSGIDSNSASGSGNGNTSNKTIINNNSSNNTVQECPLCAPEHKRVRELQRSHRASAMDKDSFFRQLRAANDGFGVVAKYFGKGLLNDTSASVKT